MRKFIFTVCLLSLFTSVIFTSIAAPDSSDWKTAANERIEKIRKRDLRLQILDADQQPVAGATVRVRQLRNHFAFGTAINVNLITNPTYAAFFKDHFQWAVLEGESKWANNEPEPGYITYNKADYLINFCAAHGIPVRGHYLFWDVQRYIPKWTIDMSEEDLRAAVDARIESAVNHYKEKFVHWDVNNEMSHGGFYATRLGDEIYPYMFQRVKELDPDAKLFVNDFGNLEGSETEKYVSHIRKLIKQGAPIDGIGAQGHFTGMVFPNLVYQRLDKMAALGLPIWITEYDCNNKDEKQRADSLEKLYRTAFSHPAVEGILMWGFWAGSHAT